MTPRDVALLANCSVKFVLNQLHSGELAGFRLGAKGYRIETADYERWRESRRVVPRPDAVGAALAEVRGQR